MYIRMTKLGKLQTLKVVQDFPSGPEVSALSFNCRGQSFSPWLGTKILQASQHDQKEKISVFCLCELHLIKI